MAGAASPSHWAALAPIGGMGVTAHTLFAGSSQGDCRVFAGCLQGCRNLPAGSLQGDRR